MAKRNASQMTISERACVFEIMAANYSKAHAEATAAAADEERFGSFGTIDTCDLELQAALIDPDLLPPAKKTKFIDTFGADCGKFEIDTTNMCIAHDKEYPLPGKPISGIKFTEIDPKNSYNRTKTFIEQGSYELDDPDGDEMVVIRIKTGKGGRQQFRVPKKVAKDMVGCD